LLELGENLGWSATRRGRYLEGDVAGEGERLRRVAVSSVATLLLASARYCLGRTSPECTTEGKRMAARDDRTRTGGISLGGILVIIGIVVMIVWSSWLGLIIALVGLIAVGGFARDKWY